MLQITSKDNPKIKEYKKLCTNKKYRIQSERFVLEGARLVLDSLHSTAELSTLFVTEEGIRRLGSDFEKLLLKAHETVTLPEQLAVSLGETESPQGVFAVCKGKLFKQGLPATAENGILILCSLQDPGNVGTVLRSAEAFGISAVVMTSDCPDPTSPKVLRSSMGAVLRVPIYSTSNAADAICFMKKNGISVYAAALGTESVSVDEISLKNAAVAIGNEGAGLSNEVIFACDRRVILPISSQSESLNAAMAATVFAWELSRSARCKKGRL